MPPSPDVRYQPPLDVCTGVATTKLPPTCLNVVTAAGTPLVVPASLLLVSIIAAMLLATALL